MNAYKRWHLFAQLLGFGLLLLTGCVAEDSEPAGAPSDAGCFAERNANRDGAPRDCFVPGPDAAVSLYGDGITYWLVDGEDTRVERLVLGAGSGASIGAWVGGTPVDGLGCPFQYSGTVVPDPAEANRLILQVWHEYAADRSCGGGLGLARITVELPAISAGEYVLRLATGGCLDLQCNETDPDRPFLDVPLSVVP